MTVSFTSDIEITLWCTWSLTVTHKACEYTKWKFNAERTGGDPVIPSLNLDTDLVMAFQMQINIARYSKLISLKDTGHNEEREEKLLERCPPGHEGTKLYIPDTLADATQGHEVGSDVMNQSDPEVSASLKGASSEKILKAIARPAAIATAALRVMHPEQYWAGLQAFVSLREKAESKELPKMSETLQYWASVFNSLSVISNRETPNHQDHLSIPECFNILTTMGNYSSAQMSMPSLQLEFRVHAVKGD
ncbi:uncharacterized protein BJ212DRAFT_1299605 [Suillus subaureus]|uniref:2OGFeDO JBP1/TET oxygenase domain-containing protein n=1 Tax=Suillus subaureus TaxID=48587 RepID=A0A9P7EBL5_9AGAM|nr:uncharacterized protein BJ212DRAFT_1299605 [Suillus subaureus]KAG1816892.1 hypothetical protein BJ212DRAFT_1299605 [Suillus subaureus]